MRDLVTLGACAITLATLIGMLNHRFVQFDAPRRMALSSPVQTVCRFMLSLVELAWLSLTTPSQQNLPV
jgi:hypothetical protein